MEVRVGYRLGFSTIVSYHVILCHVVSSYDLSCRVSCRVMSGRLARFCVVTQLVVLCRVDFHKFSVRDSTCRGMSSRLVTFCGVSCRGVL